MKHRFNSSVVSLAVAIAAVLSVTPMAHAGRGFGPMIDPPGGYQGQRWCDPDAKPGVLAFRRIVLREFPWSGAGGIGRACSIGGQSEHKEGRAWDWMVNAGKRRERRAAESIIRWLQSDDAYGNEDAMARRFGIMYLIWNRKSWSPSWGWSTYCVQRKRGCVDPDDGHVKSPHTDHVHFSFTWAGARKKTTYWRRGRTYVSSAAAVPGGSGFWFAGKNGGVKGSGGASDVGSAPVGAKDAAVDIVAHPHGWGYWVLNRSGRVADLGGAQHFGRGRGVFAAMAPLPDGSGYRLLRKDGRVVARGAATHLGHANVRAKDIASTPTGAGYWLLARGGRVRAFGDAPPLGGVAGRSVEPIALVPTATGQGYYVAASNGRVFGFGDAPNLEDALGASRRPFVAMIAGSDGYTLVNDKGRGFRL